MRRLFDRLDRRYAKICLYASGTVLLTLVAGMLLYFSTGFFSNLWQLICAVVEPAVYGLLIAYLLNPAVERVSHALKRSGWRKEDFRTRRIVGIVTCLLFLAVVVLGIALVMVLVITRSLNGINPRTLQRLLDSAQVDITRLSATLQRYATELGLLGTTTNPGTGSGTDLASMVMGAFKSVASMGSTALFSIIFSIYFLIDGDRVGGYFLRVANAAVGERTTSGVMALIDDADRVFSGYIRGQFMDALVVGVLASITLTLARVPYGPMIGLLTGLGNLIPYVGAPLGILTTILVCLADGQVAKIVIGIVCLSLIMFVDSNVINPKLLSHNVEVHPLLVIAALIAGGAVGGLAGMLIAVPAAAFLKIQLDRWLCRRESADGRQAIDSPTKEVPNDTGHSAS